jgi:hypothetical protein
VEAAGVIHEDDLLAGFVDANLAGASGERSIKIIG